MTLRIVPQIPADGTHDTPPMPGEAELARTSLKCIQGGAEQNPRPERRFTRQNSATRLMRLQVRLMQAYEEAPNTMLPLIDELVRIAAGDADPDPEAA